MIQSIKILRAAHWGMCFGVRDAIALAKEQARLQPLTVLGSLVHNEAVLAELRELGIRFASQPEEVETATAMITAHGASDKAIAAARRRGLAVVEATCPLVHLAHRAVRSLVRNGYHPIIVGRPGHVEVRGLTEDLEEFDVLESEADLAGLRARARFGVLAQTTQPIDAARRLVELLRRRFPDSSVCFVDTVCQPTKQRQLAAVELARQCDAVVVIGGSESNNTRELAAACQRHCARVHLVQSAADLRAEWFRGVRTAGITAGTSTPDSRVDEVEQWLEKNTPPAADRPLADTPTQPADRLIAA